MLSCSYIIYDSSPIIKICQLRKGNRVLEQKEAMEGGIFDFHIPTLTPNMHCNNDNLPPPGTSSISNNYLNYNNVFLKAVSQENLQFCMTVRLV